MNMYMVCKLINLMMKSLGGYTLLYMYICLHDHDYVMEYFYFMVILRSTTGPYGRPMIEVAMGRLYFHSTETVWEMIAREEWLRCRHDVAHVGHTRVNTSLGSMCIVFWIFILKTLNIYSFQIYK